MARIVKSAKIKLAPNQRFALIGKTGSGKTTFAMELAVLLVKKEDPQWEIWWLDTKGDPTDIQKLKRKGFVAFNQRRRLEIQEDRRINYVYFRIAEREDLDVISQAQEIIRMAIRRKHVLIVLDEYTQVVESARAPGKALGDAFRTGRGINVGIIGCTQEPVYVPRQLISQATHIFLFDLFYEYDLKVVQSMYPDYIPPSELGYFHGFYWAYTEGQTDRKSKWKFYPGWDTWKDSLRSGESTKTPLTPTPQPASVSQPVNQASHT